MPVESHVAVGTTIAEYVVEEPIGSGGMGEVYRARDERLGRRVALKVLLRRLADDPGFRERLLRESRLAASLDHPNVVPVYEAGEADGRLFIAMRYVDGTDLKALLRRQGALDPARAIALAAQVAAALDAAHALGLVHRDVKPSNVLIDQQGGREHVYLADFGLTQSASDREPADGSLMGSVDYVAPEQIRGEEVDGRADVYALGCLLFEMLTGSVPFTGVSEVAVVYAHLDEEPPSASERLPGLPPAVDGVLRRAMAKEREDPPAYRDRARGGGDGRARARSRCEGAAPLAARTRRMPRPRRHRRGGGRRGARALGRRSGRREGRHDRLDRPRRRPGRDDVQGLRPSELGDHEPQPRLGWVAAGRIALEDRSRHR